MKKIKENCVMHTNKITSQENQGKVEFPWKFDPSS